MATFNVIARKVGRVQTFYYTRAVVVNQKSLNLTPRTIICLQQKTREVHGNASPDKTRGNTNGNGRNSNSKLQHFRKVMTQFVAGSKMLGTDVKRMVTIRKKLKDNSYDWGKLTAEETLHLLQIRKDLVKTLPAVMVFFIPFVGYAAPVIAFMYPKHLLSHHYWLPSQEVQFTDHDAQKRSRHYLPLVREVGRHALQEKAKVGDYIELLDVSFRTINKEHPTNEQLLSSSDNFTGELLGLNHLPKYHLRKLSRAWLLFPWLPRRLLRGNLRRRLAAIRKEDAALKREGIDSLNDDQIRRLCHCRGLNIQDLKTEALKKWLAEWIELSTSATDQDDSFLAHIAIYKTMNYHRNPTAIEPSMSS